MESNKFNVKSYTQMKLFTTLFTSFLMQYNCLLSQRFYHGSHRVNKTETMNVTFQNKIFS